MNMSVIKYLFICCVISYQIFLESVYADYIDATAVPNQTAYQCRSAGVEGESAVGIGGWFKIYTPSPATNEALFAAANQCKQSQLPPDFEISGVHAQHCVAKAYTEIQSHWYGTLYLGNDYRCTRHDDYTTKTKYHVFGQFYILGNETQYTCPNPDYPKLTQVNGEQKCASIAIPCESPLNFKECGAEESGSNQIFAELSEEVSASSNSFNPIDIGSCTTSNPLPQATPNDNQVTNIDRDFQHLSNLDEPVITIQIPFEGKSYQFSDSGGNNWSPMNQANQASLDVARDGNGVVTGYNLTLKNGVVEQYSLNGRLMSIKQRNGQTSTLGYNGNDQVVSLTDSFGKVTSLSYDGAANLTSVTGPDNQTTKLEYNASGKRSKIIYADETPLTDNDNPFIQYHYDDTNHNGLITQVTNQDGIQLKVWTYDSEGRVLTVSSPQGHENKSYDYNPDGTTTVTNALGKETIYHFSHINGVRLITQVEGVASASCAGAHQSKSYDENGYLISKTDWSGNTTSYIRNAKGQELSRTEGVGSNSERVVTTEWHEAHNVPTLITDEHQKTQFIYDYESGVLQKKIVLPPNGIEEPQVELPIDHIAHWTMDSVSGVTVSDVTGGHDATSISNPSFVSGKNQNSISLNGSGQYLNITNHLDLRPNEMTVCAWVKGNSNTSSDAIFQSYSRRPYHSGFLLYATSSGNAAIQVAANTGGLNNDDYAALGIGYVNDNTWHHICASYDGKTIKVYYDGDYIRSKQFDGGLDYATNNYVAIGAMYTGPNRHTGYDFHGELDEIKLFTRVLNGYEINEIYREFE